MTMRALLISLFIAAAVGAHAAPGVAAPKTLGERLATTLPKPIQGWIAQERVEDNVKTKQVRVQRVYLKDNEPQLSIVLRTETAKTLKKRRDTFLNEKVVKAKKGEFRTIAGQRFSILKIKGEYTAMTIVAERYSVLFFGVKDKSVLFAYIATTDFARLASIR